MMSIGWAVHTLVQQSGELQHPTLASTLAEQDVRGAWSDQLASPDKP